MWHLAGVQWLWNEVVRTRAMNRDGIGQPEDRPDDELSPWFDDVSAGLVEALRSTDPATRLWSWAGGEQDAAWVARRQSHEAAVHRWDAQRAIGQPEPIEADLAADGIDEFFEWMLGSEDAAGFEGAASVALVPDDGGLPWVVNIEDGRVEIAHDVADGDALIRGGTSDLLLLIWRRVTPDTVHIEGNRPAVDRLLALADLT